MKTPTPQLEPVGELLDLDAYREKRVKEGTWPPTREDQYRFFYQWREDKKRG